MTTITTDLRQTQESARRIRYEPGSLTATNVQSAIEGAAASGGGGGGVTVPTTVTSAMSPYTPVASDTVLLVNTSVGPVTIQMPLAATRTKDLEVKDATGNAATNNISVLRSGAETLDGLTTYLIDGAYGAANFGPTTGGYYVHG